MRRDLLKRFLKKARLPPRGRVKDFVCGSTMRTTVAVGRHAACGTSPARRKSTLAIMHYSNTPIPAFPSQLLSPS